MTSRVGRVAGAPLTALAFLTRLPAPRALASAELAAAAPCFPLVGAAIGALVGGAAALLATELPPAAAAALALGLELVLTGALHLDGLADCADGLAGRDRDRALAIMRDHALGSYGASALVLDLLVKTAALAALAEAGDLGAVVAATAISRAAPLPLAAALPYARTGPGTGRLLSEGLGPGRALAGVAIAAAIAVAATGLGAVAMLGCLLAVVAAVGALARRRLGGVTGDVMGAAIELTAALALVAASARSG